MRRRVLVVEHWPPVPGHGEKWKLYEAALIRERGGYCLIRRRLRHRWLPRNGMFVRVVGP